MFPRIPIGHPALCAGDILIWFAIIVALPPLTGGRTMPIC